jgi:serine/threonine protein phosphatase PrpC
VHSPEEAAEILVNYALEHFSTDNVSVMVVRFNKPSQSSHNDNVVVTSPSAANDSRKE